MSQLSRCSYAAPTPPIKSHTIHLNCVTPLCIYFNWVAARLQRSPRLPRPTQLTLQAPAASFVFPFLLNLPRLRLCNLMCDSLNLTLHSVHKNQTACGRSCLSSRCFCLTSFPSVLSLVSIHPGRCKTILFTFSFDASILHVALHRLISSLIFFEISGMHVCF